MIENYPLYWPEGRPRSKSHPRSRFETTFAKARDGLMAELERLGAKKIILSTNIPVKYDGLPYANSKEPSDSGVAVYFEYKGKAMCFACDQYYYTRENLRAIEKTVEAIRGIERWGSSDMMERAFRGFTAIPEVTGDWWRAVLEFPPNAVATLELIETSFRRLAQIRHPDKGGSQEEFVQLVSARASAKRAIGVTA